MSERTPQATVVITTRNRREELRQALTSALAQEGDVEVLVVDDGSDDGTADMVRDEFPAARVQREPESIGLIVARNRAARLARAPVIVSLDDDAEFTDPRTVSQALADLAEPGIGAVAIPYVDIGLADGDAAPRVPDTDGVWVTAVFKGAAHALRKDVFLELGGYRGDFFHQGEEADLCLRMLDAGWWVRIGRSPVVHHHVSPRRDVERMDVYGRRNELLHVWLNVPSPAMPAYLAGYAAKGLLAGVRLRRPGPMLRGIGRGAGAIAAHPGRRRPVRRAAWRVDRRLRRERVVRLEDVAPALFPPEES